MLRLQCEDPPTNQCIKEIADKMYQLQQLKNIYADLYSWFDQTCI